MKIILLLVLLLTSCAEEVNKELYPYVKLSPFEYYYAQADVYEPNAEIPKYAEIDGKWYAVAVINSVATPTGGEESLKVREDILAINSNAYAGYEDVTEVELPDSLQSLGANSLPPNTEELKIPSLPCQDLDIALPDPSTVKKVTITDTGFADISALTGLEEVTVIDGAWPYFPTLADKEKLYFQGFFQDGVRCESGRTASGTAYPVWTEKPRNEDYIPIPDAGSLFRLFIFFATEERFKMAYGEGDTWTFSIKEDGGYSTKWYADSKLVQTGGLEYSYDPAMGVHTVKCALFEGESLKAVTQLTFTKR